MEKRQKFFKPREVVGLKRKNLPWFALTILLACSAKSVLANDAQAAMEAGNLILKKSDGIVMESEDLFLSIDQVRVRYLFRNTTPQEIRTLVAFPIARLTYETDEKGNLYQDPELGKNLNFKVMVNGKSVATKVERGLEKGKDYRHLDKATFYWEQLFPPQKTVEVTHTYHPEVGGFFFQPSKDEYQAVKEYCIDPPLLQSLKKIVGGKKVGLIPVTTLHYILSTGANWKGPIQNFRMTLDKGHPDKLVSLCMDGIRKISPTQFEVVKKNFTPKHDLLIGFFEPKPID